MKPIIIDRNSLRRFRGRAAAAAVRHQEIIDELGARLLAHLDGVRIRPEYILEVDARLGVNAAWLRSRFRKATVIELESSLDLLRARRFSSWLRWFTSLPRIAADAKALPIAGQSVDLIVASLCELFSPDPARILAEFFRVLKPNGLLVMSAFGPDTLKELRHAWAHADGVVDVVHPFLDLHDIGDTLVRVGFGDVVMDADKLFLSYPNVNDLLKELRGAGVANARCDRRQGLTGRGVLARLREYYRDRPEHKKLQATIEIAYAHAWKPQPETTSVAVAIPTLRR